MAPLKKPYLKFLKRVFLSIVFFALFVLILGISLTYIYENRIKQFSISQINKNINAKIKVQNINLSFFSHFPNAALDFMQVQIISNDDTSSVKLIDAKHIYLSFNVLDFFNESYSLQSVIIENATLNFIVDENGKHNFKLFKDNAQDSSGFLLNFQSVKIHNTLIKYQNLATNQDADFQIDKAQLKGTFSAENFDLVLDGKTQLLQFISQGRDLLKEKSIDLHVQLVAAPNSGLYQLKKGQLVYQGMPLELTGDLSLNSNSMNINAQLNAQNMSIEEIIGNLPNENQNILKPYHLQGTINMNASVIGEIGGTSIPHIEAKAKVEKLSLRLEEYNLTFDNLAFNLAFNNGKNNNLNSSSIMLQNLIAQSNIGSFAGKILVKNMWKPVIQADITSQIVLNKLNVDTFEVLEGELKMHSLLFASLVQNTTSKKWEISDLDMTHHFDLTQGHLKFKNSKQEYNFVIAKGMLDNNNLCVEKLSLITGKTNLTAQLQINNIPFNFYHYPNNKLSIAGNIDANHLSYEQIIQSLPTSNSDDSRFTDEIEINLKMNLKAFNYQEISATNIRGVFTMRNRILSFQTMSLNTLKGKIEGSLWLDGSKKNLYQLHSLGKISNVDVTQTFITFKNFSQSVIQSQNIAGSLSADYTLKCDFDQDWNLIYPTIELTSDMQLLNGKLTDVKALNSLSNYTKIDDFSNIQFSSLKNNISIKDSKITIPLMEVNSNKMNIQLSGTHTFDNIYEYHFVILLSEVMGKKYNTTLSDEFGEIEDDGYGRTRLYLTMKGQGENFEVKYDKSGLGNKLQQDLKQEGTNLKKALNEEFGWFNKDSLNLTPKPISEAKKKKIKEKEQLEKQENGEFIIDWDDE